MSEPTEQATQKWMICVVVLVQKRPRKYDNFYVCVDGDHEAAELMRNRIAKRGFQADGRRFFADEIETLNIKPHDQSEITDE